MEICTEWILCPVCGRETHDKIRKYGNQKLSFILPKMRAGNGYKCKELYSFAL